MYRTINLINFLVVGLSIVASAQSPDSTKEERIKASFLYSLRNIVAMSEQCQRETLHPIDSNKTKLQKRRGENFIYKLSLEEFDVTKCRYKYAIYSNSYIPEGNKPLNGLIFVENRKVFIHFRSLSDSIIFRRLFGCIRVDDQFLKENGYRNLHGINDIWYKLFFVERSNKGLRMTEIWDYTKLSKRRQSLLPFNTDWRPPKWLK